MTFLLLYFLFPKPVHNMLLMLLIVQLYVFEMFLLRITDHFAHALFLGPLGEGGFNTDNLTSNS